MFRAYHSLGLLNLWLNVNKCACHYFSLSCRTLSILLSFCTETFRISCTYKYSNLLAEEWQTLRRWFATPHLTLPVFILFLWILNVSLKLLADPTYCLSQHLQDNISTVTLQNSLNFIFPIGSRVSKVRRNY